MPAQAAPEPPSNSKQRPDHSMAPLIKFGPFPIPPSQIFHLSPMRLSFALVNLKPLLPGHILICPVRVVPRLSQLSAREISDLFLTVRRVSRTLERVYRASSLNVAVQDGVDAGQSVPHVHVHVIPRQGGDLNEKGGGDAIYEMMDGEEGDLGGKFWEAWRSRRERRLEEMSKSEGEGEKRREFASGPDAEERRARTEEEMNKEAEMLRSEMEVDERKGEVEEDLEVVNGEQR